MNALKLLLAGLALNASSAALIAGTDPTAPNEILARGKSIEVRRNQLDEAWAIYASKMSRGGKLPDEPRSSVESKLLNHLVETELLMQKATRSEMNRAQCDVDRLLASAKQRFKAEREFSGWLASMAMTPEIYRQHMLEKRICELVIDRELSPSVKVGEDDVKDYYEKNLSAFDKPEQVRGRQIFLSTGDPSSGETVSEEQTKAKETLAKEIKGRLDKGEDFFTLYQQYSEEPWAKKQKVGDDLLYVRGQMPAEFDEAAFSLKPNEISDIVRTKLGYHIIRISAHEPAGRMALPEVASRLREFLANQEIKKLMPGYLERIKEEASVEILSSKPSGAERSSLPQG